MKNRLLLLVGLILTLPQVIHAQWEKVTGFNNGQVQALSSQGSHLVAATLGGIYRTTNPANGWENVTAGDESQSFTHLYEFDGELVATSDNGSQAHRSTDGGATWAPLFLENNIIETIAKKDDLYVARGLAYNGFYSSTDGASWTEIDNNTIQGYDYVYADDSYFYFHNQGWVMQRTSDLVNFEEVGPASVFRYFVQDDAIIGNPNGSVIYSTDQGSTFTTLTGHPDFSNTSITIDAVQIVGDVWHLASRYPNYGMFVSTDAGVTWEFFQGDYLNSMTDFTFFNGMLYGTGFYTTVFSAQLNAGVVTSTLVGDGIRVPSIQSIARGGNRFYYKGFVTPVFEADESMSTSIPFTNFPEVQSQENNPSVVRMSNVGAFVGFLANNPALYYRANDASGFVDVTGNLFDDNLILSYDELRAAAISGSNYAILLTTGNLVVSADAGASWTLHVNPGFNTTRPIIFHNGSLYGSPYGGPHILRSDDLGATVYEFATGVINDAPIMIESNGEKLFMANATERAVTSDDGETWEVSTNSSFFRGAAYIPNSDSTIVAATFGEDRVMMSNDFGVTFEAITTEGLPPHLPIATRIYANDVSIFMQVPEGNIYRIGRAELGITSGVANIAKHVEGWMVYPNPARDRVLFDTLTETSQIDIYDLNGRMVMTQVLLPGSMSLTLNSLPNGMYIATRTGLQSGSRAQTRLLIQE